MTYNDVKYISDINNTLETLQEEIKKLENLKQETSKDSPAILGIESKLIDLRLRVPMMDNILYYMYEKDGKKELFSEYFERNK